jgi:lipoprotein-anchoring transpeptidase ErfK/SrfK
MTIKNSQKESLESRFNSLYPRIDIDISKQLLTLVDHHKSYSYTISSAKNGVGQNSGSGCTPLGYHIIRAKIGDGAAKNSVFVGRRLTGELYSNALATQFPQRDWILTRILWLSGLQVGYNRLGKVDSMQRYIYIHGTPDTEPMGIPLSHGCVRMRNEDLMDFYDRTPVGAQVHIHT